MKKPICLNHVQFLNSLCGQYDISSPQGKLQILPTPEQPRNDLAKLVLGHNL